MEVADKGWLNELTNHADKSHKTADEYKRLIFVKELIDRPTNFFDLSIVLWSPTGQWPTN